MEPRISLITLGVDDLARSVAFYRDGLGFAVLNTSEPGDDCNWAMLQLNDETIMLNTAYDPGTRPPEPDEARNRVHGDTILYFGCRDIEACHRHLIAKGIHAT